MLSPHLAAPPRSVPLSLRVMNYCNVIAQVGWLILAIGMVFFLVFAARADFSFVTFRGTHATVLGRVTEVEQTGASINRQRVHANHYEFSIAGRRFHGTSYSTGGSAARGEEVTIEYDAAEPVRSRIAGMRRDLFGPAVALVALFPLLGACMIAAATYAGAVRNRLLRDGVLTTGTLVKKSPTNMRVNRQTVYELTFAFTTRDGRRCEMKTRTSLTRALEDDAQEPLLYDPENPEVAYLLDEAPSRPEVDMNGELRGRGLAAIVMLLVPTIVIAGYAWYFAR